MYHSLIQILSAAKLIGSPRGATIAELTEKLGVSRRSAYRVLEALDELGYPYYKDEEHGNRYRLVEHDRPPAWWMPLPQTSFNVEDRVLMDYLFEQVGTIAGIAPAVRRLRDKLNVVGAAAGYALASKDSGAGVATRPVLLKAATPQKISDPAVEGYLKILIEAAKNSMACIVSYEARESKTCKKYRIHPLALFESEGGLYCFVEVPRFGSIRILALERMRQLDMLGESFVPPPDFDPESRLSDPFGIIQGEAFTVQVLISPGQAPYVRDKEWPESYRLEDCADGGLRMTFETRGLFGIKRWILGWGADARVESPQWLITMIREEAMLMAEHHAPLQ